MGIEEKLGQVILLLKSIEAKLQGTTMEDEILPVTREKPSKPTPTQLKNQRVVEVANHMDRNMFLKFCRKNIEDIIERQKKDPNWTIEFKPQSLKLNWFARFKNPNAPFYIKLRKETEEYGRAVTLEGRALIERLKKQIHNI